jgi:hypothetical protein
VVGKTRPEFLPTARILHLKLNAGRALCVSIRQLLHSIPLDAQSRFIEVTLHRFPMLRIRAEAASG